MIQESTVKNNMIKKQQNSEVMYIMLREDDSKM